MNTQVIMVYKWEIIGSETRILRTKFTVPLR
jgi:hypothetical protein